MGANRTLWDEIMFGEGVTYADVLKTQTGLYRGMPDMIYVAVIAVVFVGLRTLFYKFIAIPLGAALGLKDKVVVAPPPNAALMPLFNKSGKRMPPPAKMAAIAEKAGVPVRTAERWWRRQLAYTLPTRMTKFKEALWRFVYYTTAFTGVLYVIWDKDFFRDVNMCWSPCSVYDIPTDVLLVYWLELGFYVSLVVTMFNDIRRKDFLEMVLHHAATIGLMVYSYYSNHVRVGTLVLVVHDVADIFLELAKCCNYVAPHQKWGKAASEALFAVFAVVFFISRLVVYPRAIIWPIITEAPKYCGFFLGRLIFLAMLGSLQILHVFWFRTIAKMVLDAFKNGGVTKDDRSDDEASTPSEDSDEDPHITDAMPHPHHHAARATDVRKRAGKATQ